MERHKQLIVDEKFTFQMSISKVILEHDIQSELIINFDQLLLSYISPGKYTRLRQIAITFAVLAVENFLPVQLIYTGNTKRCLPNVHNLNMTFTKNLV